MIITDVKTRCGSRMHDLDQQWVTARYRTVKADAAIVTVQTDDGIIGYGEASPYGHPRQIADWVDWLAPALLGHDIDDQTMLPGTTGSGTAHDFAVGGIDCALWDARGKAAGKPTCQLLSATADRSVPVYASTGVGYDWRGRPRDLIDDVLKCAAAGYRLAKVRLGTEWSWDAVTLERFLSLYDEVRAAVADDRFGLAVDGNCRLDREDGLALAHALDERGAPWLEEPIAKADLEGYALINQSVQMPISGGETWSTVEQFRPFLEAGAYDIVQPDAGKCGITEVVRIGRLAARYGVSLIPHSWHNGLMAMANAHAVAALPNAPMVEECMAQGPLKWGIIEGGSRVRDGMIDVAARPGLGAALVDGFEERYPYVEGNYSVEVTRCPIPSRAAGDSMPRSERRRAIG
jgi:L-alanine-DL-glutamate epimerase-like enolase superfamily enzyme